MESRRQGGMASVMMLPGRMNLAAGLCVGGGGGGHIDDA